MQIKYLFIAMLIIFSTLTLFGQDDVVKIGQVMPDFSYLNSSAKSVQINEFKGKVILINFFATWCGPCRMELPILQEKIWNKYENNPYFKLLVIGRGHTTEEVNLFKKTNNYSLPMFADPDKSIYTKFALQYIPRNYIIDQNGVILYSSQGYSEEEFNSMQLMLDKLLEH